MDPHISFLECERWKENVITILIKKNLVITFQALYLSLTITHKPKPRYQLSSDFLFSHSSSSLLTLIHWLCRSPRPQVTMTASQMSRFVTILRSDQCFPMGSGLEVDMQLGVFRISGCMPCPWVSFSLHTYKTIVFLSSLTKFFLISLYYPTKDTTMSHSLLSLLSW